MIDADTHPEVDHLQRRCISQASMSERAAMVVELSDYARELAVIGIRRRRPDISEGDLRVELIRLLHGDEMAAVASSHIDAQ